MKICNDDVFNQPTSKAFVRAFRRFHYFVAYKLRHVTLTAITNSVRVLSSF